MLAAAAKEETEMIKHVHRKTERTRQEAARLRALRERYQREKPTPEQLLAEGGHEHFIRLGDLIALEQIMASFKEERSRKKMTMAKLSELTGIDQAALSRLENGKNLNPTIETISRIAHALGKVVAISIQEGASKEAGAEENVGAGLTLQFGERNKKTPRSRGVGESYFIIQLQFP